MKNVVTARSRFRVTIAEAVTVQTKVVKSDMNETNRRTILCPCCEAKLTIDVATGAVLAHEEKQKPRESFEQMARGLEKQKETREQLFEQELHSVKDRERILDEKFKEAMKRAESEKDKPFVNPMDID